MDSSISTNIAILNSTATMNLGNYFVNGTEDRLTLKNLLNGTTYISVVNKASFGAFTRKMLLDKAREQFQKSASSEDEDFDSSLLKCAAEMQLATKDDIYWSFSDATCFRQD
ncbi:Oidioi.mRNA.OKI2018_I69.chr2.g4072.t1.cds [Oikopleura dioica]|uniref:Oidioi.mRNA.OKI2018_I69.chr2.g4072.t1.cds n=1 Tax=Oikopleura dioica TaxID=34765 RepID=A0ABN7T012_OIKDI|nr:Oidioi.mRNA.OKI2018_I69.chr2.g4072.t1.cds [Oikopleura dioica]